MLVQQLYLVLNECLIFISAFFTAGSSRCVKLFSISTFLTVDGYKLM